MNNNTLQKQIRNEYRKLFFDTEKDLSEYKIEIIEYSWGDSDVILYISKVYINNNIAYYFKIYSFFPVLTIDCISYIMGSSSKKRIRNDDCKINKVFNSFLASIFNRKVYNLVKKIKNEADYKKLIEESSDTPVDLKILQRKEKINKILKKI